MKDFARIHSEFVDSNIPWLGKIPNNWKLHRLDKLFIIRKELPQETDQRVTAYLDGRVTLRSNVKGQKIKGVVKETGWQRIYHGDFAISGMNAHIGGMGVSDSLGKCSPIYLVLIPKKGFNVYFISHVVRYTAHSGALKNLVNTIRYNSADFKQDDLKKIWVWLPPLEDQNAIVRFLDYTDRRIKRYIRTKQKLIKLLEEEKQAIIHQAVTRGLNPDVKLKPSGVDWIGNIPNNWNVSRVKNEFLNLNNKRIPISSSERGKMTLRLYDYYGASGIIDKVEDYIFDDELLLIAEDGANLVLRNLPLAIIARGKFWVNNHAHILKPIHGNILYLAHVMENINYQPWISGAAQPKLTLDRLMSIPIVVPNLEEQNQLLAWINEKISPIIQQINKFKIEISLLQEYRTRLIADVVTGKLDVRAVASQLPEDLEEEKIDLEEVEPEEDDELEEALEP